MITFLFRQDITERALLVSLILLLGLIMYFRLIRGLKQKRVNQSYLAIEGYDKTEEGITVRVTKTPNQTGEFSVKSEAGVELMKSTLKKDVNPKYEFLINNDILDYSENHIILSFESNLQSLSKKIYLDI